MAMPAVSWTVDDQETPLYGWTAGSVALGGFSQMRGTIREMDARRLPSSVQQGSRIRGFTDNGFPVFDGRLSAPPSIRGGLASIAAQGESVRAAKRNTRLNYQNRDYSKLTDDINPPHDATSAHHKIQQQINSGGVLWTLALTQIDTNENVGFCFWTPGQPISRVAYDIVSSFTDANYHVDTYSGVGPSVAGMTTRDNPGIGAASFSRDFSWTDATHDMIYIILVRRASNDAGAGARNVLLKNLRVNGIAATDTYWTWEVAKDVGGKMGWDTSGFLAGGPNVLPLDWTSGSWADLLSYVAILNDVTWGVWEDNRMTYQHWGTREWTVYQADGAMVDLAPLELYNQVTVKYMDVGGAPREVTVDCSDLGIADPLAASGQTNVWVEALQDVQPDATLATAVANTVIPRVCSLREQGRIDVVKALDPMGRDAAYEIRAGDTVRVADRDMNTATLHRIFEVEDTPNGVSLGIESGVSIAAMLARAGLAGARAPSTAQLPELAQVAAVPSVAEQEAGRTQWLRENTVIAGPTGGMASEAHGPGRHHGAMHLGKHRHLHSH